MAAAERTRKLQSLERRIDAIEKEQEKQGTEITSLKRRQDRIEKATLLVIEHSTQAETLYVTATQSRQFSALAKDASKAILQELSELTKLPFPLPHQLPADWHQLNEETKNIPLDVIGNWWLLVGTLETAVRFIFPNRSRNTRDPNTGQWNRTPKHFVARLTFGENALRIQNCLQGPLGQFINRLVKTRREAGNTEIPNLFVSKTPEELERKRGKGNKGEGKGKDGKGRGRGRGRSQNDQ